MVQKTEALRAFTFGGEIEHVVTAEWWEGPQGVGDVQQRGTTLTPGSGGGGLQCFQTAGEAAICPSLDVPQTHSSGESLES